ncbi:hypothetical protein Tco_1477283 [Tanacetum coccineum]
MLLAIKDEAGSNLINKENDFMLDTSYGEETMEELTTAVMLMAQIQPANGNVKTLPSYDAKAISEVNASSKVHEQVSHEKRKTIIQTSNDDQIDYNIISDDPYVEDNGGTLIIQHETQLAKEAFKEREDRYLDDIVDLEEKLDIEGDDLLLHDAEMEVHNMILLSIPNEIYNSVDACTLAKDMWKRSLAKRLTLDSFDDLFYYLQQFEKLVNASRAKKLEKSHDPLALVAHTGSSSRQTSSYYMTHPTSVRSTSDDGPSYESAFISEVQSSSIDENNEPMYPTHTKIINSTIGDDQINSDIKFDSFKGNVNSGSVEKDTNVLDLCAVEKFARNAYQEVEKQQIFAQQVQTQNTHLTSQIEMYKERVQILENINKDNNYLNEFLKADERAKCYNKQAQS